MATSLPLPLSLLCAVNVTVNSAGVSVPTFNQGLHIDSSGRIPTYGANSRVRQYLLGNWQTAMTADGYQPSDPAYIAMGLYFSQSPAPNYGWVGVQDLTAIGAANVSAGEAGTGYAIGDTFSINHAGASNAIGVVSAIGANGSVTAFTFAQRGTAFVVSSANSTTAITGTGTGLEIDITALGESALQAVQACRIASPSWYTVMVCGAADADHEAIATAVQTMTPQCQYLYGTQSVSALNGTTGNVFSVIKGLGLSRAHGAYSTTQGGGSPNNVYIAAAVAGKAMGLNTGAPNSNFMLAGKSLVGITTEPLSSSEISTIAGLPGQSTGNNGNVYLNYANSYSVYSQGINGNGSWFDQILGLDMLAADCQISVLNQFTSIPSIPMTDAGQAIILNAVSSACARSGARGFLAGGVWSGETILNLAPGQSLPTGYLVQSPSYSTQTSGDRALRKSMTVYVSVILAESQQSFTIGITVQQ